MKTVVESVDRILWLYITIGICPKINNLKTLKLKKFSCCMTAHQVGKLLKSLGGYSSKVNPKLPRACPVHYSHTRTSTLHHSS